MAVSMAGFTLNDAILKSVIETMNQGQAMLVRGVFATAMVALLAWNQGALRELRRATHPMVLLRICCELCATVIFLMALAKLPLANLSAILQALPLAVTMGAALFLGEKVRWRRWLAIWAGFVGVLVVVQPGFDGFTIYSVLALVCVAFCAARDLATKQMPAEIPTLLVSTLTASAVTIAGAVLIVPLGSWSPMTAGDVFWLFAAAVLVLVGYQFIIMAMRSGDISLVAPFRYTALLWAIVLGFFVFGEIPDMAMIAGAAIVVGSGLYTLYREQAVGRRKPAAESTGPTMAPDGL